MKFTRRRWPRIIAVVLLLLAVGYVLGPKPAKPDFSKLILPKYSSDLRVLEDSIINSESTYPLKPDNEARIVWDSLYQKTPYVFVYLHGNAASQEEGDPIHEALAHRYGCNLFLSRLARHGLQTDEPMLRLTALEWMQSALDAIAVGRQLGDKIILVSTSTGSTLGLYLMSKYPELIEGHIMLSPNIDLFDPRSSILVQPFGLYIARAITGSKYYGWKAPGAARAYWYTQYRIEGLTQLKTLVNASMKESTFQHVVDPVLMLYYYLDEEHQDHLVSVTRMKEMYAQLGTPVDSKREFALPATDTHIIGSDLFSKDLDAVWQHTTRFCEEVLHLRPQNNDGWITFLDRPVVN